VLANLRRLRTTARIASPGQHTLTVWMVDPGVVVDKIVSISNRRRIPAWGSGVLDSRTKREENTGMSMKGVSAN